MKTGDTGALRWSGDGVSRVPYGIYTDPDVYEEEQRRLFRGPVWNFVGMAREPRGAERGMDAHVSGP